MAMAAPQHAVQVVSNSWAIRSALTDLMAGTFDVVALTLDEFAPDEADSAIFVIDCIAPREGTLAMLAELKQRPAVSLVGSDTHPDRLMTLIRNGATAMVDIDEAPALLAHAIGLAREGYFAVPHHVAGFVIRQDKYDLDITEVEIEWFRRLNEGITVAELARLAGYSERSMFRLLAALYDRIGVRSRREAISRLCERDLV
jgi:DNA-binding NarL/FixJ family response regulator